MKPINSKLLRKRLVACDKFGAKTLLPRGIVGRIYNAGRLGTKRRWETINVA